MQIKSLNEAMEILQKDTRLSKELAAMGEDVSIDAVLEASKELLNDSPLAKYLLEVIEDIDVDKADVLRKGGVDENLGFQVFAGITRPTFNTLFRICHGATFTLTETQKALELAGYSPLGTSYKYKKRDEVIISGIIYMKSIERMNEILYEINQTLI